MSDELFVQTTHNIDLEGGQGDDQHNSTKIEEQSDNLVDELFKIELRDLQAQHKKTVAVRDLGISVQKEITRRSKLLQQPLTKLVNDAEDGGSIGNALIALQEQTDRINPNKLDLSMGTIRRLLSKIPAIGTPLARWFAKYQSIEGVIQEIVKSLEDGRGQLERDNTTLKDDQIAMRNLIFELKDYLVFGEVVDKKIAKRVNDENLEPERKKFVEEEILFPLRQRILDIQQQLAVNQQGILTSEVIIRNNRELIRGVSRSLNVTVTALNIAATLAVALQTQKTILKSVNAVNKTTDKLLAETANNLKQQGADIHKQAAGAQLDINNLKTAFNDVSIALDEISRFRREALPEMSRSIQEMSQLTKGMDSSIKKMEEGESVQEEIILNV